MRMENYTPFPNLRFYSTDNQGRGFGVLMIKGTYEIGSNELLKISKDQEPLVLTDTYHGALNTSSLFMPSDLVPYKPRTDIILNAVARAPGDQALPSWLCGVRIEGSHIVEKRLRVTGPRHWRAAWSLPEKVRAVADGRNMDMLFKGWVLDEPQPVTEVPLHYELAYGGRQPRQRAESPTPFYGVDQRNPIGRGWIDIVATSRGAPVPAPQVEDPADPIADPYHRYAPQGFGPIPPAWLPRRPLGGTYDDHWTSNVWPNWPTDYDFAYHNSAPSGLTYPGFLAGDETIRLAGFDSGCTEMALQLPEQAILALIERKHGSPLVAAMRLDTLFLDIADREVQNRRAFLSWRVCFEPDDVEGVSFVLAGPGKRSEAPTVLQHQGLAQ